MSGPTLFAMSTSTSATSESPADIFNDPVSYLAALGLEAEVVLETALAAAA